MLSNSPTLLDESIWGASDTWVVIAGGDGATDFVATFLPVVLFFADAFFVALVVAFFVAVGFEELFLAAFFTLFFAPPERDPAVAADLFLAVLLFAGFAAFFAPLLLAFLATISSSPSVVGISVNVAN